MSPRHVHVVYKVDDHAGPLVDVKMWLEDQESEAEFNLCRVQVRVDVCKGGKCVCVCVCVWFVYDGGDHMSRLLCVCVSPCGVGAL